MELQRALRRWKADSRQTPLQRRQRKDLPFLDARVALPDLLLDTTVYVDTLQGKLPAEIRLQLRAQNVWHSPVTESELTILAGALDPRHASTKAALAEIYASLNERSESRAINPDREVWQLAGALAGLLGRLQQYDKSERRRLLNDALLFLSGAKAGKTILTRNFADFDLMLQVEPLGKVLFYDRV